MVAERPRLDKPGRCCTGAVTTRCCNTTRPPCAKLTIKSLPCTRGPSCAACRPGTVVLVCDPQVRPALDSAFQMMSLHQDSPCETVRLLTPK
ncbi:MAG: hypothetical protein WKG07_22555 [Hymenobacter sp.]